MKSYKFDIILTKRFQVYCEYTFHKNKNEVALSYHRVCGLYFLADIFEVTIVRFERMHQVPLTLQNSSTREGTRWSANGRFERMKQFHNIIIFFSPSFTSVKSFINWYI